MREQTTEVIFTLRAFESKAQLRYALSIIFGGKRFIDELERQSILGSALQTIWTGEQSKPIKLFTEFFF